MIRDLTSLARPLKNHSKFKENGLLAKIFSACGALNRGFAWGTVTDSQKSATLAVTITPVAPDPSGE